MKIMDMTKADFASVPELHLWTEWEKLATNGHLEFHSFVIIPVESDGEIVLHDSGWGCMEFCLVNNDMEPIGKIGGGSDVINLDGIGGFGPHRNLISWSSFPSLVSVKGWSIDCLPCGYLHVWTKRTLFLEDRYVCSNFEVYSEDLPRQKKEE